MRLLLDSRSRWFRQRRYQEGSVIRFSSAAMRLSHLDVVLK